MTTPAADPAARPAPPPRGQQAGGKILGLPRPVAFAGGAALVALGILWWRSHRGAAAAAGAQTAATTSAMTVGLQDQLAMLQDEINSLQSQGIGGGAAAGSTGSTGSTGTGTTTAAATKTVPNVRNMQVNAAIAKISAEGLKPFIHQTRDPAQTYIVNSQDPPPGTKAAPGSNVDLGIAPHKFPGE